MTDLAALQQFARDNGFGITAPLTHQQVEAFSQFWTPNMHFHWDEMFHPISLAQTLDAVTEGFAQLPEPARNASRVAITLRANATTAVSKLFDPPVVYKSDGIVQAGNQLLPVSKVLSDGLSPRDAMALLAVDADTIISHGANFSRATQFFGPERTVSGNQNAAPGDPHVPRITAPDPDQPGVERPTIAVVSAYINLIDAFSYDLRIAEARATGTFTDPPDILRDGFGIAGILLEPLVANTQPPATAVLLAYFRALVTAHETNGAMPAPPLGFTLNRAAWDALTRFAFLEFNFFYAYNDFERYQTALFDNEHEGDNEGCCLVFDRNLINLAAGLGGDEALRRVLPRCVITSVHEEFQDADLLRVVPTPPPSPDGVVPIARDLFKFDVFIAGGSHATYLDPGEHDLVDFQDTWSYVDENAPILYLVAPVVLVVSLILAMIEHFVDTKDFTSDEGVTAGPDAPPGSDPRAFATRLFALPMSADNHIYGPGNDDSLLLHSFAGKWGGNDGSVDKSPVYLPKTARYFRKLLNDLPKG
jgi:hypothetical protein